ncbi:MAG: radical SAM protein [Vulcanimicrobiaceae bacterium]
MIAAPGRAGLAYADARGQIRFDERAEPLADGGFVRPAEPDELIEAPPGTVPALLPGRAPRIRGATPARRTALSVLLPAGYTRLLLPAYRARGDAPTLPLFGYTFACAREDRLFVAAMRTDASDDWAPRRFAPGELEGLIAARRAALPRNRILAQLAICASEYACFTAQNVFLARGEAALPVSPKCNARCLGCISEQEPEAGIPSPQARVAEEADARELAEVALAHLARVPEGIVSFGQGCEGEPLLRATTIARALAQIRAASRAGTINCNTNGSLPRALQRLIGAGLDAVRISLNSFRPAVYAAYYRPQGYGLDDVFESVRLAANAKLRVSLNLLTHPGVTDAREEVRAAADFLRSVRLTMIQTRTLNIDPAVYFAAVGRPQSGPLGMRAALADLAARAPLGNFTHAH